MIEYKDYLGRKIELADIVVVPSGSYRTLNHAIVIGWTPTMVRTSCGAIAGEQLLVVNEQLIASGRSDIIFELRTKYQDKIDASPPTPAAKYKWRYIICAYKNTLDNTSYVSVVKFNAISIKAAAEDIRNQLATLTGKPSSSPQLIILTPDYKKKRDIISNWKFEQTYISWGIKGLPKKDIDAFDLEKLIDVPMQLDAFLSANNIDKGTLKYYKLL